MIEIPSRLNNSIINYVYAHHQLGSHGFIVGGNWDYQQGYFDYLIDGGKKSNYIRIPFTTIKGSIEDKNGVIRFGTPYLMSYEAKTGAQFYMNHSGYSDDCVESSLSSNQFDDHTSDSNLTMYLDLGRALVNEAEIAVLGYE